MGQFFNSKEMSCFEYRKSPKVNFEDASSFFLLLKLIFTYSIQSPLLIISTKQFVSLN